MSFFNKEVKKMESEANQSFFTLGIRVKKENPRERRRKRIKKQKYNNFKFIHLKRQKRNPNKKRSPIKHPEWFLKYFKEITEKKMFFKMPKYNIFDSLFTKEEQIILSSCTPSVEQQEWLLQSWSTPPFGKAESWTGSPFWSLEKVEKIRQAIFKTNKYRGVLRRFLNRWCFSRFQKNNEEDLFTCEVPKSPVQIVDWYSKSIWVFESQSLMRDITNRLLHHDGCFENPLAPRNPYTNLPLTASQTISVWSQLMRSAASFPFTAYRASRMNLAHFRYEHRIYLAIHALRKTFEDITFYETKDKILDFIEIAFERQGMEVNIDEYEYVLNHFPNTEQLHKWKHFCEKYHEFEIKYADFDTARVKAHDKIFVQTFPLLHQQKEINKIVREHQQPHAVQIIHFTDILDQNPFLLDMIPQSNEHVQEFMSQLISSFSFEQI
jgi:hypothetical protein